MGQSQNIWGKVKIYETKSKYMRQSQNIWDIVKIYGT